MNGIFIQGEILMVSLIIGRKGTGKTKHLIEEVNKALETSNKVEIDFSDIEIFTTLFFNFAFAKITSKRTNNI